MVYPPSKTFETSTPALLLDSNLIYGVFGKPTPKDLRNLVERLNDVGEKLAGLSSYSRLGKQYQQIFGGDTYQQAGRNLCRFAEDLRTEKITPIESEKVLCALLELNSQYEGPIFRGGPFSPDQYKRY